jgi:prepilin signal peptidase PulO-like enzyme (type II secretory pathway)
VRASHFIPLYTVLAAILGLVVSLVLSRWSQLLLSAIHDGVKISRALVLVQLSCGATTGTIAIGRSLDEAVIICVVAVLLAIQLPLDVFTRRLSRTFTVGAFMGIFVISFVKILFQEQREETINSLLFSAVVVSVFAALHVALPNSLGFGDVLLVAPLALAVASSSMFTGVLWLAVSSCSAAVHGVVNLIRRGERYLPFGPHLLGAAWALLVVGV